MKNIKFEVSDKIYFQFAAQVDNLTVLGYQVGDQVWNKVCNEVRVQVWNEIEISP